jgi:NAD(P)-dependent dehydrogenase (short-subunit alcohol dehydrogenase family)
VEKGEAAAQKLKQELPSWTGDVEVWQLDMASFASVKAFAQRLNTLDRLDILIESAGVSRSSINLTIGLFCVQRGITDMSLYPQGRKFRLEDYS